MVKKPDYYQPFKISFATRLVKKLREKGFISRHAVNSANGNPLAQAIGISLPMARKYINAKSIPTNATLQKIANWLETDPLWLLYGSTNQKNISNIIDRELLQEIFVQLFPLFCNKNISKELYMAIIMGGIDIYNNILTIKAEQSKDRAISLMVNYLKNHLAVEITEPIAN